MGLFKRGRVWWMTFTHNGRHFRRSTETSDRSLAEAIEAKIKVKIIEGRYFETLEERERTFPELMERYLSEHAIKRANPRCYQGYVKNLRSFFDPYTLAEITPRRIVEYKARRYADGVAPATINRELACMKKAFNLAIREWEWCRENPVSRVSMEKEDNRRDRWLTDDEEKRLLLAAPLWVREIVLFALHTGMRMGEVLSLTWNGVDLARETVMVFRSKNGERRTIPINQTVLDLLRNRSKVKSPVTDLVFHGRADTAIDGHNLRRAFRAATKRAEIKDLHFHDLRHTFATRLIQSGVDLYKVQRLLGHKSPVMTQRYAHHYPESLRDGVKMLDRGAGSITFLSQSANGAGKGSRKLLKKMVSREGLEPSTR